MTYSEGLFFIISSIIIIFGAILYNIYSEETTHLKTWYKIVRGFGMGILLCNPLGWIMISIGLVFVIPCLIGETWEHFNMDRFIFNK